LDTESRALGCPGLRSRGRHSNVTGALRIGRADYGARSPRRKDVSGWTMAGSTAYYKTGGLARPGGRPADPRPPAHFPFPSFLDSGDAASLPDASAIPTPCTNTARPAPSRSAGPGHRRRLAQETHFPPDPLRYEYGAGRPFCCARLATEIKGLRHHERIHGSIQRTP
jgi:hypothetical protein